MGWTWLAVHCILMDTTSAGLSAWALITRALDVSYHIIIPSSALRPSRGESHRACRSFSYHQFNTGPGKSVELFDLVSLSLQARSDWLLLPCHAALNPPVTDASVPAWMLLDTLDKKWLCREQSMTRTNSSDKPFNFHTCQNLQSLTVARGGGRLDYFKMVLRKCINKLAFCNKLIEEAPWHKQVLLFWRRTIYSLILWTIYILH